MEYNMKDKLLSVSEPKVMQSAAGFYIGKDCKVEYTWDDGETMIATEPYTRLSGYFGTPEQAKEALEAA